MMHEVYVYYDADGRPLYVGCTSNFWQRHASHRKLAPWFDDATSFKRTEYPSKADARAEEARLIAKLRPLHNKEHHPERHKKNARLMSRQPVPGEAWTTRGGDGWTCLSLVPGYDDRVVWQAGEQDVFVGGFHHLTPPPELPPAELVASVRMWVNVYRTGWSANRSEVEGERYASPARIWRIHPDGRWQKCNGKDVIGEPVEVRP